MVGRSHSKALVMILFGGLLGYAAASEKLDPFQQPSATALPAGTSGVTNLRNHRRKRGQSGRS